jgi:G:T-mismatch repair DNA endonuclease (very short patch repair protein)
MAACLAGPAVASHRAAARLWRLPGFETAQAEVTAYRHRRRHRTRVLLHESRFLDEYRDTTVVDGIPVTTATRTIVDLSRVATVEEMELALDNARHRGLTDATRVRQELDRLQRRNGTKRIEAVLELKIADIAPPESPLESRTAIVLREGGLPTPTAQFEVHDSEGFVGRVDFAWPDRRLVLEVDGFAIHGNRAAWERDQRRQNRLVAAGWRVLRISHERLADPEVVVAELRRSLGAV